MLSFCPWTTMVSTGVEALFGEAARTVIGTRVSTTAEIAIFARGSSIYQSTARYGDPRLPLITQKHHRSHPVRFRYEAMGNQHHPTARVPAGKKAAAVSTGLEVPAQSGL